jgi:hypothetical protein
MAPGIVLIGMLTVSSFKDPIPPPIEMNSLKEYYSIKGGVSSMTEYFIPPSNPIEEEKNKPKSDI